jgi:uncharacterized protein (DUF302 family)
MSYYIATKVAAGFDETIARVEEALKAEGFGVLTRIDVKQTLKAKIGAEFRPYTILGACNPSLAHEALQLEDKVGTMLPCNVVVQSWGKNETEIARDRPRRLDAGDRQRRAEEGRSQGARAAVTGDRGCRGPADDAPSECLPEQF